MAGQQNTMTGHAADGTPKPEALGTRRVLHFWWPLASTWLMMATEGLFLSALIARLDAPRENLAAYGVAFAFAIIIEAPVILLMSAATALVKDAQGYRALWRFTVRLNLLISLVMIVLVLPPVWRSVGSLIGLDPEVSGLVHGALVWLLPWPAAIGDRRFHQGVMIRGHRTRRIAAGTLGRVLTMATVAVLAAASGALPGASVAGAALGAGVVAEMFLIRRMARPVLEPIRAAARELGSEVPDDLSQVAVFRFYLPLALTSVIALASQPVITFFMGRSVEPLASLAVLPVLHGLTFIFRALALSYQDVAIALVGEHGEHFTRIRSVAVGLAVGVMVSLGLIAWTPLGTVWLRKVAGLDPELARFALLPLRLYAFLPVLSVVQAFQRSMLVHARATGAMGWATAIELAVLSLALALMIGGMGMAGAVAAALATLLGRVAGISVLFGSVRRVTRPYGVG